MAKKTKKVLKPAKRAKAMKAPKAKKTRKVTRQHALPGMGQVRNAKLDKFCENIGEARARKNEAILDEEGDSQAALRAMQSADITHYTHAGVELILRRGADKLSVKLLKDKTAEGAIATPAHKGDAAYAEPAEDSGDSEPGFADDLDAALAQ